MTTDNALEKIRELIDIMEQLRGPEGCPWDARQTPETLKPYLIEETYELLEAIDQGEPTAICEELGDLLLQVVFHATIFKERGTFSLADVANGIATKMRRRHPHVFETATCASEEELHRQWDTIKLQEKGKENDPPSILAGIPTSLPPSQRVHKVIDRTTRAGMIWPEVAQCGKRASQHLSTIVNSSNKTNSKSSASHEEEFGQLLFVLHLLAKQMQIDPDRALLGALSSISRKIENLEQNVTVNCSNDQPKLSGVSVAKIL